MTDTTSTVVLNATTNATYNVTSNRTYNVSTQADTNQLLMYSWAWSIMQRFVVNEPVIIFVSVWLSPEPHP